MALKHFLRFILAALLLLAFSVTIQAQSKSLYWDRFDFDINVQANGDLRIVETQKIVFTSGVFTFGTRGIQMDRLRDITDVEVREGGRLYRLSDSGEPYTYQVYQDGSERKIKWFFPPTGDTTRTYTLSYTVKGALRYYNEGDQVWWVPIVAERSFPVNASRIVVHLPEGARVQNYDAYGAPADAQQVDEHTVVFTSKGRIPAGQELEVRVEFTHGVVAGTPSPWQAQVDEEQAARERQAEYDASKRPIVDLITLTLSLFIAIAGLVGLYLLWYSRGRDRPVGLVADYLAEPPSDLPPGVVGTLLDEQADMEDIIATIVDLARRGILTMQEVEEPGLLGIGSRKDFIYRLEGDTSNLRPYEKLLVERLFGVGGKERRLSDLKEKFYTAIPKIKAELYNEVVREGFFKTSPERTRNAYATLGIVGLIGTAVLGFCGLAAVSQYTTFAICLPISLGLVFMGLIFLARFMPSKTAAGAEASARWRAFKRYLENIEKYTKLEESKDIFDKYLPYAVAFGLERSYVRKFASVQAPAPTWYYPAHVPYGYYGPRRRVGSEGGRGSSEAAPSLGREQEKMPAPSLDSASEGIFSGLDSMSSGLFGMLDAAARTLSSAPQPSSSSSGSGQGFTGRGWSGGGRVGGGGGGRGSAGFG